MLGEDSDSFGEHLEPDQQSLLVFVDFSEGSRQALVFAANLAADLGAALRVVHVIHDPADAPGYYQRREKKQLKTLERLEDSAAKLMEKFIDETKSSCRSPQVLASASTALPVGLPLRRMIEITERLSPRLVIVGSQGRTNLSNLLVGSKTAQFVRVSPCPVVVVKE